MINRLRSSFPLKTPGQIIRNIQESSQLKASPYYGVSKRFSRDTSAHTKAGYFPKAKVKKPSALKVMFEKLQRMTWPKI